MNTSEDIRVPTLWEAAAKAGYVVGSVSWPVTVGARGISWLIPEYCRASTDDDLKLMRALSTPGMMKELEPQAGRYETDLDNAIPGDWARTHYAEAIIRRKHARFMTVHLAALDHMEHESGPFSPDANSALEEIDRMVGMLERAKRDEARNTAICIVSDHGFAAIDHQLNIAVPFVKAGLITLNQGKTTTVRDWTASPWNSGGVAFVVLKDPRDRKVRGEVEKMLHDLAADPANGVNHILDRAEIAAVGGAASAEFAVDMKPGFSLGAALDGPAVREIKHGGTHGYSPAHPEMLASFLIAGPGIRQNFDVGEIDMRNIAPTLASYLGASFTTGDLPALAITEGASAAAKHNALLPGRARTGTRYSRRLIPSLLHLSILATLVAIASAAVGVALLGHGRHTRMLIPLSGGLLIGVAVFGLIPELVLDIGWLQGLMLVAFGYVLLKTLDRFAFSVCPSCAHDHSHEACAEPLHGFAGPLLAATAIHAFVDGWGLVAIQVGTHTPGAATALAAALFLHKIPEGVALGTLLRASVNNAWTAFALCAAVEVSTVVGGAAGLWLTPANWVSYPLAIAGGTFLFLGVHAVHGDWKRRGARPAFIPALAGAAGAALLQQGLRMAAR